MNNILVTTFWSFKDSLIQSYTLPYLKIIAKELPAGSIIYLTTLEQDHLKISSDEESKIRADLKQYNIELISISYKKFGINAIVSFTYFVGKLIRVVKKNKIKTIHSICTAGGVLGYIVAIFTNTKLIIDSYEPHAEACVENGQWTEKSIAYKILFFFEKRMSKKAAYFIACSSGMRAYAKEKYGVSINEANYFVKPACVDLNKFSVKNKNIALITELGLNNKIVCVYAGKFGAIYLDNEVFELFAVAQKFWGDQFRVLLLTNTSKKEITDLANNNGLDPKCIISKFVPYEKVPEYLAMGTFGITPVKSIPTKQFCTPIKDGEYWAMGLPVIITPNISDDSSIIEKNNIGAIWNYKDKNTYTATIAKINDLINTNASTLSTKIRNIAIENRNFSIAENIYKNIYQS